MIKIQKNIIDQNGLKSDGSNCKNLLFLIHLGRVNKNVII